MTKYHHISHKLRQDTAVDDQGFRVPENEGKGCAAVKIIGCGLVYLTAPDVDDAFSKILGPNEKRRDSSDSDDDTGQQDNSTGV